MCNKSHMCGVSEGSSPVSGSVPDVSWGLDRHRGKKMRTRGADTWQRGKTSLSTSGMFSRPIKSHF